MIRQASELDTANAIDEIAATISRLRDRNEQGDAFDVSELWDSTSDLQSMKGEVDGPEGDEKLNSESIVGYTDRVDELRASHSNSAGPLGSPGGGDPGGSQRPYY